MSGGGGIIIIEGKKASGLVGTQYSDPASTWQSFLTWVATKSPPDAYSTLLTHAQDAVTDAS